MDSPSEEAVRAAVRWYLGDSSWDVDLSSPLADHCEGILTAALPIERERWEREREEAPDAE